MHLSILVEWLPKFFILRFSSLLFFIGAVLYLRSIAHHMVSYSTLYCLILLQIFDYTFFYKLALQLQKLLVIYHPDFLIFLVLFFEILEF